VARSNPTMAIDVTVDRDNEISYLPYREIGIRGWGRRMDNTCRDGGTGSDGRVPSLVEFLISPPGRSATEDGRRPPAVSRDLVGCGRTVCLDSSEVNSAVCPSKPSGPLVLVCGTGTEHPVTNLWVMSK
jgi:hypothetical protein